jgi:gamma-glutamylcyclotransferase (GGCT)/AIG2-like uncharacterized protein YtfP
VSEYLFTYGTLQPGRAPAEIAPAVATLQRVGAGRLRGLLYDLGEYPGAVPDETAATEISGTVMRLPADEGALRQLDEYEEFNPASPEKSLFVRRLYMVRLDSGTMLQCWIYVYNRDPKGAPMMGSNQAR